MGLWPSQWLTTSTFGNSHDASHEVPINTDGSANVHDLDMGLLHPEQHIYRDKTTIQAEWNVTLGMRKPDGVWKAVYLVNGEFPGPTIEARSGDRLLIKVNNGLEADGISIHWHGLKMMGQNAFDGVSGVTQCPIPPDASFEYSVVIGDQESGTFWWHGHSNLHRGDGLYGGLVIHKPAQQDEKLGTKLDTKSPSRQEMEYGQDEERLLLIGDWYHRSALEVMEWYQSPRSFAKEPVPDSMLINGRGHFDCSDVQPGRPVNCTTSVDDMRHPIFGNTKSSSKCTRLRIVNVGSLAGFSVAIPGMIIEPVEVDGGNRVHYEGSLKDSVGILYPGERVDVLLSSNLGESAAQSPFTQNQFLVNFDKENFQSLSMPLGHTQIFALFATHDRTDMATKDKVVFSDEGIDLSQLKSKEEALFITQEGQHLSLVVYAKTQLLAHKNNLPLGFINNTSWEPQARPLISEDRSEWEDSQFAPFVPLSASTKLSSTSSNTDIDGTRHFWVDMTINNLDDGSHPFHLHGYSFYVLSTYRADRLGGWGSFNPFSNDEPPSGWDLERPLLKDTVAVPRRGHIVIRFLADNPGIWMLHCHMLIHQQTGLGMMIHVGAAEYGISGDATLYNEKHRALCTNSELSSNDG